MVEVELAGWCDWLAGGADATSEGLSRDADRDAEHFAGGHPPAAHSALSLPTRTT